MAYYAPFGNFQNEVVDPSDLQREWEEAKKIADSMTHWQMCTEKTGNRLNNRIIENGASVVVHRKGRGGYSGHGFVRYASGNEDYHADAIGLWANSHRKSTNAWLVPSMKGWQEVFDGDCAVEWTATYPELVMFSMSWRTYRLTGKGWGIKTDRAEYFSGDTRPRIKLALQLDGETLSGTGPGMNVPTDKYSLLRGQGTFVKTQTSTSTFVKMVPAGTHRASPVGVQGPSQNQDRSKVRQVNEVDYFSGAVSGESVEFGVAVPHCVLTVIRFPRGTSLGG